MTTETLYTTKQVASLLGVSTGLVRRLARKMELGRWVGSVRLFTAADLDAMRRRDRTPGPKGERT